MKGSIACDAALFFHYEEVLEYSPLLPPSTFWNAKYSPAKSSLFEPRQVVKVFWFFSSEKNKTLLFLKKKKQKDFDFPASCSKIRDLAGKQRQINTFQSRDGVSKCKRYLFLGCGTILNLFFAVSMPRREELSSLTEQDPRWLQEAHHKH